MPHANLYTPTAGFSDDANRNTPGRSGVNATSLDNELLRVSESINLIINNQKLMQRDDGRLKDTVVEVHTLSREVLMLLGNYRQRGAWSGQTSYTSGDVVTHDGLMYVCKNSHVSESTFIESPNWLQFGFAGSADAAQAAAQATSAATKAANSAASAQSSAMTATTKASDANTSAQSAASSANSAQTASTSASNSASQATSANNAAQAAAAVAQSAAQVSGISNERIIYGDDASKTSAVTSADLATTSGFFESSSDVPENGVWHILNHKLKSSNIVYQEVFNDVLSKKYSRTIINGVKGAWNYIPSTITQLIDACAQYFAPKTSIGNYSGGFYGISGTLSKNYLGSIVVASGSIALPNGMTTNDNGSKVTVLANQDITISTTSIFVDVTNSGAVVQLSGAFSVLAGELVELVFFQDIDGAKWVISGGTLSNRLYSKKSDFSAFFGSGSWTRRPCPSSPSGFEIIQFGIVASNGANGANGTTYSFPIQFPIACKSIIFTNGGSACYRPGVSVLNNAQFKVWALDTAGNFNSGSLFYIAVGH